MALGEQFPVIRIDVEQRLTLEPEANGPLQDDASVATEITYFDRVGNSYILEGVLTFSGSVGTADRAGEAAGQHAVSPVSCRLPFALRIPVKGQPDFLDVNTRIGEWDVKPVGPGQWQLQAELSIQGLNGQNGYSFYCGDQEISLPPQASGREAHTQPLGEAFELGETFGLGEALSGGADVRFDMQSKQQEAPGSDEWEWRTGEKGGQGSNRPDGKKEPSDLHAEAVEAPARGDEEVYQFEALADELQTDTDRPAPGEAAELTTAGEAAHEAEPVTAEADAEVEAAAVEAAEADIPMQEEAVWEAEVQAAPAEPASTGPKLTFGAKKEEADGSPVKLSGLADGSLAKQVAWDNDGVREEPGKTGTFGTDRPMAAGQGEAAIESPSWEVPVPEKAARETAMDETPLQAEPVESCTAGDGDASEAGAGRDGQETAILPDAPAGVSEWPIWSKWLEKDAQTKYTLKFRIVQEAESLDELAHRYGTPVESLMRANGLTHEQVDPGQVLIIPGRRR